jgi:Spx/MgsR family transcriptional regulator
MMPSMNNTATALPPALGVSVFGIPNCDTVKKARTWLAEHGVAHTFHDFKKGGVPAGQLPRWIGTVGWEKLVNRKGTTWRQLDATVQAGVVDAASASALMLAHPSVVKRPVVVWANGAVTVGFEADGFLAHLP